MIIRHYEMKDETAVVALIKEAGGEFGLIVDETLVRKHFRKDDDIKRLHLIVSNDDGIKGTAGIVEIQPEVGEICQLYLAKELRGSGKGKFLLDMLINFAKNHRFKKIVAFLSPDMSEALDFFRRNNFKEAANRGKYSTHTPKDRKVPFVLDL